jgi:hypothetical protein
VEILSFKTSFLFFYFKIFLLAPSTSACSSAIDSSNWFTVCSCLSSRVVLSCISSVSVETFYSILMISFMLSPVSWSTESALSCMLSHFSFKNWEICSKSLRSFSFLRISWLYYSSSSTHHDDKILPENRISTYSRHRCPLYT